jgi:hypothetical protein
METALLSLFSLVFIVFAFGINIIVMALRSISEAIFKKLNVILPNKIESFLYDFWNEWVLPASPIVIGGFLAYFLNDYPYPENFAGSCSGRIFFGLIAGFFSSTVYRFAKFNIQKYLPKEVKKKLNRSAKNTDSKEVIDENSSETNE